MSMMFGATQDCRFVIELCWFGFGTIESSRTANVLRVPAGRRRLDAADGAAGVPGSSKAAGAFARRLRIRVVHDLLVAKSNIIEIEGHLDRRRRRRKVRRSLSVRSGHAERQTRREERKERETESKSAH